MAQGEEREQMSFQQVFLFIGKLEPAVVDDFDAVVAVWIMGRRNHHARGERTSLGRVSQSGRGDQSGKASAHAFTREPSGKMFRDPLAAFAGVHSDDYFGLQMRRPDPACQRHSHGEGRRLIERVFARNAPDAIRTE